MKPEQKKNEKTPFSQRAAEMEKGNLYREKTDCTEKTRRGQKKRPLTVLMFSETVLFSAKREAGLLSRKTVRFPFHKSRSDRSNLNRKCIEFSENSTPSEHRFEKHKGRNCVIFPARKIRCKCPKNAEKTGDSKSNSLF